MVLTGYIYTEVLHIQNLIHNYLYFTHPTLTILNFSKEIILEVRFKCTRTIVDTGVNVVFMEPEGPQPQSSAL